MYRRDEYAPFRPMMPLMLDTSRAAARPASAYYQNAPPHFYKPRRAITLPQRIGVSGLY